MSGEDFVSRAVQQKAEALLNEGKVILEGVFDRNVRFVVKPLTEKNGEHTVFMERATQNWSCNCKGFALQRPECAHIRACKGFFERMNGEEEV